MRVREALEYRLLRALRPAKSPERKEGSNLAIHANYRQKIVGIVGTEGWEELKNKVVLDFGCGFGLGVIELAQHGVATAIGLDIRPAVLEKARQEAKRHQVADRCVFCTSASERVDVIISIDAFEHFDDPADVLQHMSELLKPEGCVLASFGPVWFHPYGGHSFSVFPWAHLIFSESALLRWRADFKTDGANRFREVEGGLNQMTVKSFVDYVNHSAFTFENLRLRPIRALSSVAFPWTREFTTAIVEAKLVGRTRA